MRDFKNGKHKELRKISIIMITLVLLLVSFIVSIRLGVKSIGVKTIIKAFTEYDRENSLHVIIMTLRMPRIITGVLVGAAFAVSGAIMQGMTRNPMASPSLLGINAGAGFGLAVAMVVGADASYNMVIAFSFLGAALASAIIYGISSIHKGSTAPMRLALAGAAITSLFSAFSQALAVTFKISQELTFWNAGGVSGVRWEQVKFVFPWIMAGLLFSLTIAKSITILSLGDEISTNLGEKTKIAKLKGSIIVLVLTGASVSAVGPVGFVGLIIPHAARYFMGTDYKWVIPYSMILGALLIVIADMAARMVNPPFETPLGAITAVIGVPFFLYLATRDKGGNNAL